MTSVEADAFALSLVREAMTKPAGGQYVSGTERPRTKALLADISAIIANRADACYGWPWKGDAKQADELARAIVQRFLLEDR